MTGTAMPALLASSINLASFFILDVWSDLSSAGCL